MSARPSRNVLVGFGVHLFTASGAFWAFLALVAAAEKNYAHLWFWLGIAMIVDGVDGPLARMFNVKKVLPHWSGEMLDSIIDYVTYALIPAFALYQSGFLLDYASFICAALIVCISAIYYADTRTKSHDNFFIGFPICWNMLVFTLFVIEPNWYIAMAVVILSALLVFTPFKFVHPVRVVAWRPTNLAVVALWSLCGIIALYCDYIGVPAPGLAVFGITVASVYLYCIGMVMQILGKA